MKPMPSTAVKQANRQAIIDHLYRHGPSTKQHLQMTLGLSLPTITANLRDLEDEGLVGRGEPTESTGGRKAQTHVFAAKSHAAIGVRMRADGVTLVAVDLYGEVIARKRKRVSYRNTSDYYDMVGDFVTEFAGRVVRSGSQVLGIAFSIQGIVSPDGSAITFGQIVGNTGLTLEKLTRHIEFPALMIHDSDASAMAELWFDPSISDAVCIYLERRPGGAVIAHGTLYQGPNLSNGTVEHMCLVPGGKPCYCGQRGCMDPYCSPEALLEDGEGMPGFFSVLSQGERGHRKRFDEWMGYVAQAIVNIRSVIAGDVIIGGEAAQYLDDDMLTELKHRAESLSPFTTDFTLKKSICIEDQNTIGAALRFVRDYVDARHSFSEWILAVMMVSIILIMLLSMLGNKIPLQYQAYMLYGSSILMYGSFIITAVESLLVWRKVKRTFAEAHPRDNSPSGTGYYTFSRMIRPRRWRSPRPQVDRGQFPK